MVTTEICPLADPDYLAGIADNVDMQMFSTKRKELMDKLFPSLTAEQKALVTELDNLAIEEINMTQSETVKEVVCKACKKAEPCALK